MGSLQGSTDMHNKSLEKIMHANTVGSVQGDTIHLKIMAIAL